jgi:hypothetical protein
MSIESALQAGPFAYVKTKWATMTPKAKKWTLVIGGTLIALNAAVHWNDPSESQWAASDARVAVGTAQVLKTMRAEPWKAGLINAMTDKPVSPAEKRCHQDLQYVQFNEPADRIPILEISIERCVADLHQEWLVNCEHNGSLSNELYHGRATGVPGPNGCRRPEE